MGMDSRTGGSCIDDTKLDPCDGLERGPISVRLAAGCVQGCAVALL